VADDLYYRSTTPGSELMPLLAEPAVIEGVAALSPDGRWIAYVSTEGGQPNVYVRPFPDVDRTRALVSDAPATGPRWAPDMSEVYYRTLSGDFVAASVNATGSSFSIRSRTTLFPYRGFVAGTSAANYDVHPDGDRFLMVRLGEGAGMSPVEVVRGFAAELRSAMSEAR
jgi:serine/threonine-protein kinase